MTKKTCGAVYLSASLHDSVSTVIFDAQSDKTLDTVERMELTVDGLMRKTRADLYFSDGSKESVDVVQAPVFPGSDWLRKFSLRVRRDNARCSTVLQVLAEEFQVAVGGAARSSNGSGLESTVRIDDFAMVHDPVRYVHEQARQAFMQLGGAIFDHHFSNSPLLHMAAPRSPLPPVQSAAPLCKVPIATKDCPECYGTGLHKGWGGPCSRGCSPKP